MTSKGCALIVEDDDDLRLLMSMVLDYAGYQTTALDSAAPALALAQHDGAPSVDVVDVRMPGMNGHALCRRLKADCRTNAPVLLVSAECSEQDIADGYDAGCDDFLPKPFHADQLLERVERLLLPRPVEVAG
ncbi:MAG: hypothetical protein QOI51_484 [Nocardioidaceae bacterium]|nr:hypothetical protein [Nocardioidaceae bacterium]